VAGLFVNYRQADQPMAAAALDYLLAVHFGRPNVFRDCVSVDPGADYARAIVRRLETAEVLVVVIGPGWLAASDNGGQRLIDRPGDWVRAEIRIALDLRITILPVLMDDAPPPAPEELPADIRAMARFQAMRVRHDSFGADYRGLLGQLERHVRAYPDGPPDPAAGLAGQVPRGRWRRLVPVLTPVAAAALPTALAGLADRRRASEWLAALAATSTLALAMFLLGVLVVYATRSWSDSVDRQLTAMPSTGRQAGAIALVVAFLGGTMLVAYPLLSRGFLSGPLLFVLAILTVAGALVQWLYQQRLDNQWPPVEVRSEPAAIRGARARLLERLDAWTPPLPRGPRMQAEYALRQLEEATAGLRELAVRNRRAWLRVDSARLAVGYPVWILGTVGMIGGAAVLDRFAEHRHPFGYLQAGAAVLAVAVLAAVTGELRYRHQRWQQRVVVEESSDDLRLLRLRLVRLAGSGDDPLPG